MPELAPFLRDFPDDQSCLDHLWRVRFAPDGRHASCARCGLVTPFRRDRDTSHLWRCTRCGAAVSVTAATLLDRSPIAPRPWFVAAWTMAATSGDATAEDVARHTGLAPGPAAELHQALRDALRDAPAVPAASLGAQETPGHSPAPPDTTAPSGADVVALLTLPPPPGADAPPCLGRPQRSNLPPEPNRFIGRRDELAQVVALLAPGRCLTLAGTGGSGKTRLALETARRVLADTDQDVWWVDLTRVKVGASAADAMMSALGLRETPGKDALDDALVFMRGSSTLIVFDNCEHVLDEAAVCVQRVLDELPDARVLATSREPIRLAREVVWRIPPMTVPGDSAAVQGDAVALFVERATAVRPSFTLAEDNEDAVARICRQLDGLPLALELAAAQSAALSPAQIAGMLSESLTVLNRGNRGGSDRHRTIRASIGWSHSLLDPVERAVFRRLSVFATSFSLECAQFVSTDEEIEPSTAFAAVVALVHKSLLAVDVTGPEHRYRMLETVRQYATEQLEESGEAARVRTRQLERALEFIALEPDHDLEPGGSEWWFDRLDLECGNMRAALDWAMSSDRPDARMRLGAGLGLYFAARGRYAEGRQFLADALADPPNPPPESMARALWAGGYVAFVSLNLSDALNLSRRALRTAEENGDVRTTARALATLGAIEVERSPRAARTILGRCLAAALDCGDPWAATIARGHLAHAWIAQSKVTPARETIAELDSALERVDAQRLCAWHGLVHGFIALRAGDPSAASAHARAARDAAMRAADPLTLARWCLLTAEIAVWTGSVRQAYEAITEADTATNLSSRAPLIAHLVNAALAKCELAEAAAEAAAERLRPAAEYLGSLGRRTNEIDVVTDLATAAILRGASRDARQLLSRVEALAVEVDDRRAQAVAGLRRAALAMGDGAARGALSLALDALTTLHEDGHRVEAVSALALVAVAAAARDDHQRAARLLGAVGAERRRLGVRRTAVTELLERDAREAVAKALGWDDLRLAVHAGAELSFTAAVEYAKRGRGTRGRPTRGWDSLTETEIAVARLVAKGLTNAAIAAQLLMSRATVKAHLARIFAKLDISRRAELGALTTRHLTEESADDFDEPPTRQPR